ncbi:ATP-binding protein [Saccharothrix obliqua]|uniref:ATP-binding protein n=1 Tax=Saccharothrix obliqua TaxID=2861747 RepID=UPI001C5FDA11|nr:tetratricopeptide repeat protein [Saccharothrix obliqua]MBW4718837.1 tetratricopeptide repeat protein [Saccharothrix obliqua]
MRLVGGNDFSGGSEFVVQTGSLEGGVHLHARRRDAFPPPRQLPLDVLRFVNREVNLVALDAQVGVVPVSTIAGPPGVGKSALAVHWGHRVRGRFPDGDLYLDMHGYGPGTRVSGDQALDHFLRALNVPPDRIPGHVEARASLYRSLLDGKRVLVVLDNVTSVSQVRPLLPASPNCLAVITSRSRLSGLVVREGAVRMTLEELSTEESLELLRHIAGADLVDSDPPAARQVVGWCAHLPLALRIVGERLASRPRLTLADLAAELSSEHARLDALGSDDDELSDVRTVFSWSYQQLQPDAARLFRLLGLHPGPDISEQAAAALADLPPARAHRLLDALTGAHLLSQPSDGRFRLHDLLRLYAVERAQHDNDRDAAVDRLFTWYLTTADAARRAILPHSHAIRSLPAVRTVEFDSVDSAMAWYEEERQNLLDCLELATRTGRHRFAWQLPVVADGFFELRSYWHDWYEVHRLGLAAARAAGDRYGEASNLLCLGDVNWRRGTYDEALTCYTAAVGISREIGDRWLQGFGLRGTGLVHEERRRFDVAIEHFRAASEVFTSAGIDRGVAMCLLSIGNCHRHSHRFTEAVEQCERAVAAFGDLGDPWSEAWGRYTLGLAYQNLGRLDDAHRSFSAALGMFQRYDDHRSVGMTLTDLGEVLQATGDTPGARRLWSTAVEIFEVLEDQRAHEVRQRLDRTVT